jgi:WD40 repeat protein
MKYCVLVALVTAAALGCAQQGPPHTDQVPARLDPLGNGGSHHHRPVEAEGGIYSSYAAFVAGGRVLSSGDGREVAMWDATTGTLVRVIQPQLQHPGQVLFLPDGQHAVTIGPQVVCWDVATGKERWSFADQPQTGPEFCAALSPDGCWGVHANQDGALRLWDTTTGQVRTLTGPGDQYVWITFSPDGQWLMTGSSGGSIKQWMVQPGVLHRTIAGEGRARGAFSPDGKCGLTVTADLHTAALWDVVSGKEVRRVKLAPQAIQQVGFLPDGKRVLAVGEDRVLRMWELKTGKLLREFHWQEGLGIGSVAVSSDGKRALFTSAGLALWDLEKNEEIRTLQGRFVPAEHDAGAVVSVAFAPGGRQVLAELCGGNENEPSWRAWRAWDAESGRLVRSVKVEDSSQVTAWSADPTVALTCIEEPSAYAREGCETVLQMWDVADGRRLRTLERAPGRVECATFSPDRRFLLAACLSMRPVDRDGRPLRLGAPLKGSLQLWDLTSGKLVRSFGEEQESYQCVHLSADGRQAVSGGRHWQVWEVPSGRLLHRWPGPEGFDMAVNPYRAAFSQDDKRALTYGEKLQLWDLTSGALLQTWAVTPDRHLLSYTAVAFSADGKWALSAGGPARAFNSGT